MKLHRPIILEFMRQHKSVMAKNTLDGYYNALIPLQKFADGRTIDRTLIMEYRAHTLEQCKASSYNVYMAMIKKFFNWAKDCGHTGENPVPEDYLANAQAPKREVITEEEFNRLIQQAENKRNHHAPYWPLAMRTAWHTGLRLSDVALMQRGALDMDNQAIRLIPKKTKRKQKHVEIPVPQELLNALWLYCPLCTKWVFPDMSPAYDQDGGRTLSFEFHAIAERAEVKKTFHCFRHAFITRHVTRGVSPAIVAELCGISLDRVMTYLHTPLEDKRKALAL